MAIILAIIGVGAILSSLTVISMDHGSCPSMPTNSSAGCDHNFPGTNIFMAPVAQDLGFLGGALLIFSLIFYALRGRDSANDDAGRPLS